MGASLPPINLAAYLDAPLDQIPNLYALHGACRLIGNYRGPLYTIRRESDSATMDVYAPFSSAYGWPLSSTVVAWASTSPCFVTQVYDQTGNGRPLTQATAANQPYLKLDGTYPLWDFDGASNYLDGTTNLAAFGQNASGASVIVVRKHALSTAVERCVLFMTSGTGNTRMAMGPDSTTLTDTIGGRRLDADGIARPTGFTNDANWGMDIGRWDWANGKIKHTRYEASTGTASTESANFAASGVTSNTAATMVRIGTDNSGFSYFAGNIACIAWVSAAITDTQVSALQTAFTPHQTSTIAPGFLRWGSDMGAHGTYTVAPGKTDYTILTPSGATPTAADLASHRYHHHACTTYALGRQWLMTSSALNNEDGAGELALIWSTADLGTTWTAPAIAVPSQQTMGDTLSASDVIVQPNGFQTYGGNTYLIAAISNPTQTTSYGMCAAILNSNGTTGAPFLITPTPYTPLAGITAMSYDSTLGPNLLRLAQLTGVWGGAKTGSPQGDYIGYYPTATNTSSWTEPVTFPTDGTGLNYQRLWRKVTGGYQNVWWSQLSTDGGTTWGAIYPTRIPNAPGAGRAIRLPDGRIAMVGNPLNAISGSRDPLYLALYAASGTHTSIYAVQQGVSSTPTYAGAAKAGGAQYPSINFDGTNLWVGYSIHKETVGISKIPLAGL